MSDGATSVGTGVADLLLLAVVLVIAVLVGLRRRRQRDRHGLSRREWLVSPVLVWADPAVAAGVVLGAMRQLLVDPLHLGVGALGLALGLAAGLLRGRLILVAVRPDLGRLVVRRGAPEVAILVGMVLLSSLARATAEDSRSPLVLLSTLVLTLGLGESLGRAGWLTSRYRQQVMTTRR